MDRIQDVLVTFWGTAYTYVGDDYASGIIVGVMTDPQDIESFVPVDTCYIKNEQQFNRFAVSLANYQGDGKYVAFVDADDILCSSILNEAYSFAAKNSSDITIWDCSIYKGDKENPSFICSVA